MSQPRTHPRLPGRHLHWHLLRRRRRLLRAGTATALLAVVGPGILAGLSDDDPAGITTYSILGAKYGYELLWVLALSTVALIVFHELGARMGIVTGKGLMALIREHSGRAGGARTGRAGPRQHGHALRRVRRDLGGHGAVTGLSRYITVPIAAVGVSLLVLRGSFRRVEHVLLALGAVFVSYILSGFLAHPDWGATAEGLAVPRMPGQRDAVLVAVATVGTTLAPWGLAFIQSYAVDKRLQVKDLRYERVDVIVGAVMTGVIGLFVVVACAATLHAEGITTIDNAGDAAKALEPLAGGLASTLSASASSAPPCSPRRSCRSRPLTRSRRRPARRPTSTTASSRRASSIRASGRRRGGRRARPDPRRPPYPDPLPLAGAERGTAAGPAALHAPPRPRSRGDGRERARRPRPAADRRRLHACRRVGSGAGGAQRPDCGSFAAGGQDVSISRPCRRHVPTPPLATWSTFT